MGSMSRLKEISEVIHELDKIEAELIWVGLGVKEVLDTAKASLETMLQEELTLMHATKMTGPEVIVFYKSKEVIK